MKRNIVILLVSILVGTMLLFACDGGKGLADQALKAAEQAINSVKGEAMKYVPDQYKSLENALAAAKDKFAKKDYKAAASEAQALVGKAKELVDQVKVKKEELTKNWTDLSAGLPKMVDTIQSRLNMLSKSKKLPSNLTPEKLADAKAGLAAAKEEWAKALESSKNGMLADAVSAANSVKGKAAQVMEILGLPVPAGAK